MNGVTAGGAFGTFAGGALVAYCYMQRDRPCEKQPKESTDNQIMEKGIVVGEERVTRDIRAQEAAAAFDVLTGQIMVQQAGTIQSSYVREWRNLNSEEAGQRATITQLGLEGLQGIHQIGVFLHAMNQSMKGCERTLHFLLQAKQRSQERVGKLEQQHDAREARGSLETLQAQYDQLRADYQGVCAQSEALGPPSDSPVTPELASQRDQRALHQTVPQALPHHRIFQGFRLIGMAEHYGAHQAWSPES